MNLGTRNTIRSKLSACAALRLLADGGYGDNRWLETAKVLETEAHALWREAGLEDCPTWELLILLDEPLSILRERQRALNVLVSDVMGHARPEKYPVEYVERELYGTSLIATTERWAEIKALAAEVRELEAELEA